MVFPSPPVFASASPFLMLPLGTYATNPELGIAQLGAFKVFRNFDDACTDWHGGAAGIDLLHRVSSGMSHRRHICLHDPQLLHRLDGVEVLCRLTSFVQSHTFRD